MKYPRFEEKIRENIVKDQMRQDYLPTQAIVLDYDPETNTARIISARPGSEQLGEIYDNVPCPQQGGLQTVAPQAGYPCQISFPNGTTSIPVITTYFNPRYYENDYAQDYLAVNDTPRFLMEL